MREPCGEKDSTLNVRGKWLSLARGESAALRERAIAELEKEPAIPPSLQYLWDWWRELDEGKSGDRISYRDIEAWSLLLDHEITPEEVTALFMIDRTVQNPGKREDHATE